MRKQNECEKNAEITRTGGVRKKGTGPAAKPKVTRSSKKGMTILGGFLLGVVLVDGLFGELLIYNFFSSDAETVMRVNAMWAYGAAHAAALGTVIFKFRRRE